MDAQRALLDSLMGFNRDGDRPDEATMDFRHPRVCKPYLCGLCPRELFQNTRLDTGACEALHLPNLRSAYQEQTPKRDFGYERQLANELSKLLADVEKKIARAQRRLDEDGDAQDRTQVLQLTQDMQEAAAQAEQAAKDGATDRATQLMEQVQVLKRKRKELLGANAGTDTALDNVNQKLRVCDVCGAFLSIFDSERRLADHFGGKVHVGYVQIRQKLKELMAKQADQKQRRRSRSRSRSKREGQFPRENRRRHRERSRSREDPRDRRTSRRQRRRRSMSSSPSRSPSRSRSRERPRRRHRH